MIAFPTCNPRPVACASTGYFDTAVNDQSLNPAGHSLTGATRYADWLTNARA